jgi:hypothetical protein
MTEKVERPDSERYTTITLSPECRAEIEQVRAATGATRSTIHETLREWVELQVKGKILSLYLERVGRRAGALNGGKAAKPPIPKPRRTAPPPAQAATLEE